MILQLICSIFGALVLTYGLWTKEEKRQRELITIGFAIMVFTITIELNMIGEQLHLLLATAK